MRVHALQLHRSAPPHFRGLMGLGSCTPMGTKYSDTPNGACIDSGSGSVVDCLAAVCGASAAPAPGASPSAGPNFTPDTTLENIPIGGFTGTFAVPTLAADLSQVVFTDESPFVGNLIAKGADSVSAEEANILAEAQQHCGLYPNSTGCDQLATLVAQAQAQYAAWAATQKAGTYQAADTGPLGSPLAPSSPGASPSPVVYTGPAAIAAPTYPGPALSPNTASGSPAGAGTSSGTNSGTTGNTGNTNQTAAPFNWSFLTNATFLGIPNWILGLGVVGGLIALSMLTRRGR